MSQQNPSPRKAVVAFGVPMSQTIINALGVVIANNGSPWDAEDMIYACRDHAQADRATWATLETLLAGRADPEEALLFIESIAANVIQGQPPNPSSGTESEVLECWGAHALTAPARRARLRALSRLVADRSSPGVLLAALVAAAEALPAVA